MMRRAQFFLVMVSYLAVALFGVTFAQPHCPCITGTILDAETDEPRANLTVRLVDMDGNQVNQVSDESQPSNVTGDDGSFILEVSDLTIDELLSDSYFLEVYEGGIEGILRFRESINLEEKALVLFDTEELELQPIAIP